MYAIQITRDGAHQALIVEPSRTEAENAAFRWFHTHTSTSYDYAVKHGGFNLSEPFEVNHKWTTGTSRFRSLPDAAKQYADGIRGAERAKREGAITIGLFPPKTREDETATLDTQEGRWFIHVWSRCKTETRATKRRVKDLRPGDRIDLENDEYADPEGFRGVESSRPEFQFAFETVEKVERETPECTRVDFESGLSIGFPPDHLIDVDGEQEA